MLALAMYSVTARRKGAKTPMNLIQPLLFHLGLVEAKGDSLCLAEGLLIITFPDGYENSPVISRL